MLRIVFSVVFVTVAVTAAPYSDERIVGGSNAALGEHPYVVSLKVPTSHSCGGSILSERFILTAAHCVDGSENSPGSFRIQYGVTSISSQQNILKVKRIIKHEKYSPGGQYANDVAVIELAELIKFGPNAQPVKLPSATEYPGNNASAILVGWGKSSTNGPIMNDLQKVNIVLFTNEFCESKEYYYNRNVHVCAGVAPGGKGQCNGDSGGPLTVNGKQYGVVSWSVKPCASQGHPGIFAKVTQYRAWIKQHTGV